MTMVQYETKFKTLQRFASDLVPTKRRTESFYKGIIHEIRMAYLVRKCATFGNIIRATGEAERVIVTRPRREFDQRQQHPSPYQLEKGAQ